MKDDSGEVISKKIIDWLTGIITLAAALSTIIGVFFSDDKKAQQAAYIAALILILVSGAIYFYQRRRAAKLKIAQSQEPLSASAALRGLLPFEEGDQLPGRARDVQEIYTLVASSTFRFGVLWGESGCGKTSLLRAGLTPKLRNEKFIPLYINKPTQDPQEAIRSALLKEVPNLDKRGDKNLKSLLKGAAPKGKKIVILFDQFEEFFLTNRTPSSRAGFVKWLGEAVKDENLPVAFLLGIRADFFAVLQNFAPQIPEPTSTHSTYQLQNFDTEQAKQIFSAAAKADGIPFEPELIQAVIRELETEEFIRPAELQVVGTRLKRKNVTRLSQYEALGGARGILSSYINEEIKQSANEQAARLVLRLMCADAVETKSPTDLDMDKILRGVSGSGETDQLQNNIKQGEIQKILNQFVTARVLIHTDENKYNLAHDYLAPYVRTATEGTETNTERANRMLKRYVAEYKEDPKTRIPFGRIRWIQKYASVGVKSSEKATQLLKRSKGAFYGVASIPLIMLTTLYLFLASSYYFGIDEGRYIVIVSGNPQWKAVPGFDQVVIQTDFMEYLLDPNFVYEIRNGLVKGFWFQKTEERYQLWGEQLATRLEPISQARIYRWLGQPERSATILYHFIVNPSGNFERFKAGEAIGQLIQVNPELITSENLQTLSNKLTDPQNSLTTRYYAGESLGQLMRGKPETITKEMFQLLMGIIIDPQSDGEIRSNLIVVMGQLAEANPEAVPGEMFQTIFDILTNPQNSYRYDPSTPLGQLARARPEAVTEDMLRIQMNIITDSQYKIDERVTAINILGQLAVVRTNLITPDMVHTLFSISVDPQSDIRQFARAALGQLAQSKPDIVTSEMLQTLLGMITNPQNDLLISLGDSEPVIFQLAQAKPEAVTPEMLQTLFNLLTNPQSDANSRGYAGLVLGKLAQGKPEAVTPEMIQTLFNISTDAQIYPQMRLTSIDTLGQLALAKPDAVTSEMLPTLLNIFTDPQSNTDVRYQAGFALGQLARAKPEAVTPEMLQTIFNIMSNPHDNLSLRFHARSVFGQFAIVRPEAVTSEMVQGVIVLLADENFDARSSAGFVLGQLAQAKVGALTPELIKSLVANLGDTRSSRRHVAAYALFEIAFRDPGQEELIHRELEKLHESPRPNLRIAASQTSEMIMMGNLAREALINPTQIGNFKLRYNFVYSANEPYLNDALTVILDEIEKISTENK